VRRSWLDGPAPRVTALVLLFAVAGFHESIRQHSLNSVTNGDFWWHLRTGLGILASHAVPRSGLYSQSASLPWMASSWLYDVLVAVGFKLLDPRFVAILAIVLKFALAVLTFVLAGGMRGRFWTAIVLSAVAQYILGGMPPLPVFFSVLAFAIELILLMDCRTTGDVRLLYWLPLLFLLWANLDVQFVVGVFVLLLFLAACAIEQWGTRSGIAWLVRSPQPPLSALGVVTVASLVATVITPYGWNCYGVFFARATSAANSYFPDYQSLRFRSPQDYLLLLLAMSAFLALGIRRSRDLFLITLLVLGAMAAFHAQRDAWLVTLASVAIVGNAVPQTDLQAGREDKRVPPRQFLSAAGLALLLLAAATAIHLPHGRAAMLAEIGEGYPVAAADYIRQHQLPQPLFNSFPWGGFLTWYLPEYPVAIDGRTDLYGDDFNIQYAKVMNAEAHYSTFPPLARAGTILLEKKSLMGSALPHVAGFNQVYADDVAVVLVREPSQP
jgi:hypothetical protein